MAKYLEEALFITLIIFGGISKSLLTMMKYLFKLDKR